MKTSNQPQYCKVCEKLSDYFYKNYDEVYHSYHKDKE